MDRNACGVPTRQAGWQGRATLMRTSLQIILPLYAIVRVLSKKKKVCSSLEGQSVQFESLVTFHFSESSMFVNVVRKQDLGLFHYLQ